MLYLDLMIKILKNLISSVLCFINSRHQLELEIILLRQQLNILKRKTKKPKLLNSDRILISIISRYLKNWEKSIVIVKPQSVIIWHRRGFKLFWKWKSRKKLGRPGINPEIRKLIRDISLANRLWGAPRIHGELLKLGIEVSQATVRRYMPKKPKNPSQTWRTFLTNHMHNTASIDFFVVPTITFKLLFVFVILSHDRRRIVHFNVTASPTAFWTGQQIIEAFPWDTAPKYLLRDNDSIYGADFSRRVYNAGIKQVRTSFRSPWQNAYCERVIGSIRRECTDHFIVLNEVHLKRILREYVDAYYNVSRTHLSLNKDCPEPRTVEHPSRGEVGEMPILGGLHHRYHRRAA